MRPRAAAIGEFENGVVEQLRGLFPTFYYEEDLDGLESAVDKRELDVLIVGHLNSGVIDWADSCHTISFSSFDQALPGPLPKSYIGSTGTAETEEYRLPSLELSLDRVRKVDLGDL